MSLGPVLGTVVSIPQELLQCDRPPRAAGHR
jgi:hypothetical protein